MLIYKVLFVDDDRNLLAAIKRQFRGKYDIVTVSSGKEALYTVSQNPTFAVIVADMQMPNMDGVTLLSELKNTTPDSTRVMLTGNADQETAIKALNQGNIFRFLNKPCSTEDLTTILDASIQQYKLVTAEKELLQNTLSGSVKVLTDLLSILEPNAFGATLSAREKIKTAANSLGIKNLWELELAWMLSDIGRVILPQTIIAKLEHKIALDNLESEVIKRLPLVTRDLIKNIPRLDGVAGIVFHYCSQISSQNYFLTHSSEDNLIKTAKIIYLLKTFLPKEIDGDSENFVKKSLSILHPSDESLVRILENAFFTPSNITKPTSEGFKINIKELCAGQRILEDITTEQGVKLISAGTILNESMIQKIMNYALLVGVKQPFVVDARIPTIEGN